MKAIGSVAPRRGGFAGRAPMAMGSLLALLLTITATRSSRPQEQAGAADVEPVVALLELVVEADDASARRCLNVLCEKIRTGELGKQRKQALRPRLQQLVGKLMDAGPDGELYSEAVLLSASLELDRGVKAAFDLLRSSRTPAATRRQALSVLISIRADEILQVAEEILAGRPAAEPLLQTAVLEELGGLDQPRVATLILERYDGLDASLQPKAIELLTQRAGWSKQLLRHLGEQRIPRAALNANQVRKLMATRDVELQQLVNRHWGAIRGERNPQREQVITEMRTLLRDASGDPHAGDRIFAKLCGQCHSIHGKGETVGPDITANGRASLEQLLSNVFDPSLVIGASYQARTVVTVKGRVLTGLLVEDNQQRIVLKMQGGKQEIIPREFVEEVEVSELSLMPEGLEKQLTRQEIVDLFAFLTLDRHPDDPEAKRIPDGPAP